GEGDGCPGPKGGALGPRGSIDTSSRRQGVSHSAWARRARYRTSLYLGACGARHGNRLHRVPRGGCHRAASVAETTRPGAADHGPIGIFLMTVTAQHAP